MSAGVGSRAGALLVAGVVVVFGEVPGLGWLGPLSDGVGRKRRGRRPRLARPAESAQCDRLSVCPALTDHDGGAPGGQSRYADQEIAVLSSVGSLFGRKWSMVNRSGPSGRTTAAWDDRAPAWTTRDASGGDSGGQEQGWTRGQEAETAPK